MNDEKEIVYCKNCKFRESGVYCPMTHTNTEGDTFVLLNRDDDFCSRGKAGITSKKKAK